MRRKIIKQGLGGNTIFLPIKWVRTHNLKVGDDVFIEEQDNTLQIKARESNHKKGKKITFEKKVSKSQLRSIISSSYKAGYNDIQLTFKKGYALQTVMEVVNSFTGLEIVNQGKHTIRIRCFLQSDEKEIENLIIKLFQVIQVIITESKEKKTNLKDLQLIFNNGKKIRDHCLRAIHITKYGKEHSYDYYDLVTQLEKLSADFFKLAQQNNSEKQKNSFLPKLEARFEETYNSFLKKDFSKASQLWNKHRQEMREEFSPTQIKKLSKNPSSIHYYHVMQRFLHLNSRIMSLSSKF